ncbi:MAG: hypothetical protein CVU29_06405 [Betaproteobacteria bacterium HGW-Betaproteobacteria-22]|nr:MAG: hypothetical protein CVU29_06405 [Betaproteobacteria bacterium HGW-Betaproteobacteria-22]
MRYFNKLPGFIKTPAGLEWVLFKKIPLIFAVGTAVPVSYMLTIYLRYSPLNAEQQQIIYQCLGLLFTIWFFVGTLAIGCVVVMLMKGPAYVADPYDLPKENKQLEQHPEP